MTEDLETLLRRRGLSWAKVAKAAGISQRSLYNWRTGRNRPHPSLVAQVARVLGVAPGAFLASLEVQVKEHRQREREVMMQQGSR